MFFLVNHWHLKQKEQWRTDSISLLLRLLPSNIFPIWMFDVQLPFHLNASPVFKFSSFCRKTCPSLQAASCSSHLTNQPTSFVDEEYPASASQQKSQRQRRWRVAVLSAAPKHDILLPWAHPLPLPQHIKTHICQSNRNRITFAFSRGIELIGESSAFKPRDLEPGDWRETISEFPTLLAQLVSSTKWGERRNSCLCQFLSRPLHLRPKNKTSSSRSRICSLLWL